MTIVIGQIESLTRIKAELSQRGISRFNSVAEINVFIKNYEDEKERVSIQTKREVKNEIASLEAELNKLQEQYENLRATETDNLEKKIEVLTQKNLQIQAKKVHFLMEGFQSVWLEILHYRITRLQKHFNRTINKKTAAASEKVHVVNQQLNEYRTNEEKIIADRTYSKMKDMSKTKEVVDSLYTQIAGAVGENLVVNELKKLSDKNILYNDYSIVFNKPIYNRKEKDSIYSIQIDHLLITHAGVFIIETKNWSKKSIANIDLRSPIKQIRRTSYALFTLLNKGSKQFGVILKKHHWGDRQIPIRNVVVMIHKKPKEKFNFVQVKTLNELNRYINYFEPIFDDAEVNRISDYLGSIRDQNQIVAKINRKSKSLSKTRQRAMKVSDQPNLKYWLKNNPGKTINDYYSKFGR